MLNAILRFPAIGAAAQDTPYNCTLQNSVGDAVIEELHQSLHVSKDNARHTEGSRSERHIPTHEAEGRNDLSNLIKRCAVLGIVDVQPSFEHPVQVQNNEHFGEYFSKYECRVHIVSPPSGNICAEDLLQNILTLGVQQVAIVTDFVVCGQHYTRQPHPHQLFPLFLDQTALSMDSYNADNKRLSRSNMFSWGLGKSKSNLHCVECLEMWKCVHRLGRIAKALSQLPRNRVALRLRLRRTRNAQILQRTPTPTKPTSSTVNRQINKLGEAEALESRQDTEPRYVPSFAGVSHVAQNIPPPVASPSVGCESAFYKARDINKQCAGAVSDHALLKHSADEAHIINAVVTDDDNNLEPAESPVGAIMTSIQSKTDSVAEPLSTSPDNQNGFTPERPVQKPSLTYHTSNASSDNVSVMRSKPRLDENSRDRRQWRTMPSSLRKPNESNTSMTQSDTLPPDPLDIDEEMFFAVLPLLDAVFDSLISCTNTILLQGISPHWLSRSVVDDWKRSGHLQIMFWDVAKADELRILRSLDLGACVRPVSADSEDEYGFNMEHTCSKTSVSHSCTFSTCRSVNCPHHSAEAIMTNPTEPAHRVISGFVDEVVGAPQALSANAKTSHFSNLENVQRASLYRRECDSQSTVSKQRRSSSSPSLASIGAFARAYVHGMAQSLPTIVQDASNCCIGMYYSTPQTIQRSLDSGVAWYYDDDINSSCTCDKNQCSGDELRSVKFGFAKNTPLLFQVVRSHSANNVSAKSDPYTQWGRPIGIGGLHVALQSRASHRKTGSVTQTLYANPDILQRKLQTSSEDLAEAIGSARQNDVREASAKILYLALTACSAVGLSIADIADCMDARSRRNVVLSSSSVDRVSVNRTIHAGSTSTSQHTSLHHGRTRSTGSIAASFQKILDNLLGTPHAP